MTRGSSGWLLFFFLLALSPPFTRAQGFRGSLVGTITDASGGRIQAAEILVRSDASGIERHAVSTSRAEFRFDDLSPAPYLLVVKAPGFADARSTVTVVVASVKDIAVTMYPGSVQQSVNVPAEASSITTQPMDISTAVHGGEVTAKDLQTFPLAARSCANIAYLVPGTEPVEPSDPSKARITAVAFGGSSGLNDVLSVDGGDNSDDYIGGFLQNFSPDVIRGFAVRTAQEDADTGRTVGGSVVITTKRGTHNWHGDEALYERAAALNARFPIENPAPLPKQPFSRQNYIGSVGGPLKKDKLFFFSSIEYVHEDASIAYSPASLTQFNALASL